MMVSGGVGFQLGMTHGGSLTGSRGLIFRELAGDSDGVVRGPANE